MRGCVQVVHSFNEAYVKKASAWLVSISADAYLAYTCHIVPAASLGAGGLQTSSLPNSEFLANSPTSQ